jgi:hypothetical protein
MNTRIDLQVPFAEKDQAKAAGARWDANARAWYVQATRDQDLSGLARWLPPAPYALPSGPTVAVGLAVLSENCWRCGALNRPVVGVAVAEPWAWELAGFGEHLVEYEVLGEPLSLLVDEVLQTRLQTGPIKLRRSRTRGEPYWANGCRDCDAIFGAFPLQEALNDALADAVEVAQLVAATVDMPRACLDAAVAALDDDWPA